MKKIVYFLLSIMIIIGLWYCISLKVNPLFIPNPLNIFDDFKVFVTNGTLFIHLWYTFKRIMIATCLSGAIALPLGLFVRNSKIARVLFIGGE